MRAQGLTHDKKIQFSSRLFTRIERLFFFRRSDSASCDGYTNKHPFSSSNRYAHADTAHTHIHVNADVDRL